jgi:FkbM family methyltransferase
MDQAFLQRVYEPSAEAAAALDGLGRPPVVLDLGANIGMYGAWVARRWHGARVIAVEPLPRNVDRLRHNLASELPGAHEIVAAAATTADGEIVFGGGDFTNGRVLGDADPGGGIRLPARDMFALAEGIDLLKLDIEGGEWPILADPRFSADLAPVVMLEHHPMGAPEGATPEKAAESALERAGYDVRRTVTEFAGAGILWGVRRGSGRALSPNR